MKRIGQIHARLRWATQAGLSHHSMSDRGRVFYGATQAEAARKSEHDNEHWRRRIAAASFTFGQIHDVPAHANVELVDAGERSNVADWTV